MEREGARPSVFQVEISKSLAQAVGNCGQTDAREELQNRLQNLGQ
jgi:hypothetical protein